MPLFDAAVVGQRPVAEDYYELTFSWPAETPDPVPGQFVTVRVADSPTPLLRRPFGVSAFDRNAGTASMIYWRRGPATRLMAGYEPGDTIQVMGPLGHGFPDPAEGRLPVLVAGGVGIGPLWYLATLLGRRTGGAPEPLLIVGARTASGLPDLKPPPGLSVLTATDDGSAGTRGTAITVLEAALANASVPAEVYLCGPHAMLAAGHRVATGHGVTAWVSMEQTMGCAVGACMGCVVETVSADGSQAPHYERVCTEGPVFRSTEVVW